MPKVEKLVYEEEVDTRLDPPPGLAANDPPDDLAGTERAIWLRLQVEYGLEDGAAIVLLEQLCRNLQLVRECRERIEADGKVTAAGREHPLLKVMRDADKAAATALRHLNFDLEPLRPGPGRPPGH